MSQCYRRVALVSNGSRGVGAATVRRLAADGWDVSFCHRGDDWSALHVEKVASELGARVLAMRADPTDAAEVSWWARRTEEELGPVDAVVSCAGISGDQPLALLEDADWRTVIDAGLDGAFQLCRANLFTMMRRRCGAIVVVSSVCGVYAPASLGGYPSAGAGIADFTRALASLTARYGIRVNALAPVMADVDLTAIVPEPTQAAVTETIALRRFGSAADVADRVTFLLSDRACAITGTVLELPDGMVPADRAQLSA
jgi:3-oxoacyl-[acyl-carrier protein] reductase